LFLTVRSRTYQVASVGDGSVLLRPYKTIHFNTKYQVPSITTLPSHRRRLTVNEDEAPSLHCNPHAARANDDSILSTAAHWAGRLIFANSRASPSIITNPEHTVFSSPFTPCVNATVPSNTPLLHNVSVAARRAGLRYFTCSAVTVIVHHDESGGLVAAVRARCGDWPGPD
jgi:hypothetical protein